MQQKIEIFTGIQVFKNDSISLLYADIGQTTDNCFPSLSLLLAILEEMSYHVFFFLVEEILQFFEGHTPLLVINSEFLLDFVYV